MFIIIHLTSALADVLSRASVFFFSVFETTIRVKKWQSRVTERHKKLDSLLVLFNGG